MSKDAITPHPDVDEPEKVDIYRGLREFRGVRSHILRIILYRVVPSVLFLLSFAIVILTKDKNLMYLTLILAVFLSIVVFELLMNSIPDALRTLWDSNIITCSKSNSVDADDNSVDTEDISRDSGADANTHDCSLEKQFLEYIRGFQRHLNSLQGQMAVGMLFALLLLARSIYEFGRWMPENFFSRLPFESGGYWGYYYGTILYLKVYFFWQPSEHPLEFLSGTLLEPIIGFILGLVAWRMLITGIEIAGLSREFELVPILNHPDKAGGLASLGRLCLYNALIVTIWSTFLGGWIILGSIGKYSGFYTQLFYAVLPIPIAIAAASFLYPLYGAHQDMQSEKMRLKRDLDKYAGKINELARKKPAALRDQASENSTIEGEINKIKKCYGDYKGFPTWPYNTEIQRNFIISQILPLLSLTPIGQTIAGTLASLIGFILNMGTQ